MIGFRKYDWIKQEPRQHTANESPNANETAERTNASKTSPVPRTIDNMRSVLGSYMSDKHHTPSLPMIDPNETDPVPLEQQLDQVTGKTIPVIDDAWQRTEEYEKDALLATGQMGALRQRLDDERLQVTRGKKKNTGNNRRKRRQRRNDHLVPTPPDTLQNTAAQPPSPTPASRTLTLSDVMGDLPIETLRQHALRNDNDARFLTQDALLHRIPDEVVASVIPYQDVIAWIVERAEKPLWFRNLSQLCVDSETDLPELEVLTWAYVQDMLREPDPSCEWERPCLPPVDGNTGQYYACESMRMGGPMLREFLLPSEHKTLMRAVHEAKKNPRNARQIIQDALPPQRHMCFLCYQQCTTTAFTRRKFDNEQRKANKRNQRKLDNMTLIHDYIMAVHVPGEWDIDHTLPGYEEPCGLAGPVLTHNHRDYVPKTFARGNLPSARLAQWLRDNDNKKHLDGWTMVDDVFFQPGATRVYSDRQ